MHRVENATMSGMPDVEGHLLGGSQFWIELKSSPRPARETTPVRFKVRGREAQVHWLRRRSAVGGRAWLLLQVGEASGRSIYLVPGTHAREVYDGVPERRLRELSVLDGDRPSQRAVVYTASGHGEKK